MIQVVDVCAIFWLVSATLSSHPRFLSTPKKPLSRGSVEGAGFTYWLICGLPLVGVAKI